MSVWLLIGIFALTIVLIVFIKNNAVKLSLLDVPNERSVHKKEIARGAGIGFVLSVFVMLILFKFSHVMEFWYIYLSIFIVFLAGTVDDVIDISPKVKFGFIFVAALILLTHNFLINSLGSILGFTVTFPHWTISYIFTALAIIGYTNAMNLVDGLDGLAGSVALVILTTFLMIGYTHNDEFMIVLSSAFMVSLLAFLIFNWNPASIFMGDSGSLTLGMVIVVLTIYAATHYVNAASVLFIIALPLIDTFIVMTRRFQRKQSLFQADKNHLHHFLFSIKGETKHTVKMFVLMQIIFSIIGYQVSDKNEFLSLMLFVAFYFLYLNLFDQRIKHRPRQKLSKEKKKEIKERKKAEKKNSTS